MKRALVFVLAFATDAAAHLRDPYMVAIHFKPGDPQRAIAGTTFGLIRTEDGGATWRWTCEQALHYQDPFDPDYAYAATGRILEQGRIATWLKRDTCGDDTMPIGATTASVVEVGPDDALYAAASDDFRIYKSTDGGASFQSTAVATQVDAWTSLEVAPANAQRVYLAGFRYVGTTREHAMFVSVDGGAAFTPIASPVGATGTGTQLEIAAIGPGVDTVYVLARYENDTDFSIYKSVTGGTAWTRIFTTADRYGLAFLLRASGELVAATRSSGAWRSLDGGASWLPIAGAPHISTLAETPAGEVWAGTQNFLYMPPPMSGAPPVPADGYALMRSSDLVTWTPMLKVEQLTGPELCAPGTLVHEECVVKNHGIGTAWCCLVGELKIDPSELDCAGDRSCGSYLDGRAGDATIVEKPECCGAGGGGSAFVGLVMILPLLRPRAAKRRPRADR
jgi:hypothetical protein